ncbi:MAG: hypothetical protein KJ070_23470 [Verrucomicrobia bacterium]|nr:hypothetical protein [Verrucomicrobiota bacterium]
MKRALWLWSATWPIVRQTQMKNPKLPKMNGSKSALRKPQAGTSASMEEQDLCCQFLKAWLSRRPGRSEDDLAAALLIYMLWYFRNSSKIDGLFGISFHPGNLDFMGVTVPHEALKGLQVLANAGLVAPYLCEGEPIYPTGAPPVPVCASHACAGCGFAVA